MNLTKIVLMSVVLIFATMSLKAKGIEFQKLTLQEALDKAKSEKKSVFIDIYATWCGPCKYLSKNVFPDQELGEFMNKHFISIKLDGEKKEGAKLMVKFDLDAYPTMLFLSSEKKMLNKIVGVVPANEIKRKGTGVRFPESTALYKLEKKYNAGNRERALMKDYIKELIVEEKDSELMLKEYLKLYPKLDLKDSDDFLIFTLGINDLEDEHMVEFLKNTATYSSLHEELSMAKMKDILIGLIPIALEKGTDSLIDEKMEVLYPPYKIIFAEEAYEEERLIELLKEMYEESKGK